MTEFRFLSYVSIAVIVAIAVVACQQEPPMHGAHAEDSYSGPLAPVYYDGDSFSIGTDKFRLCGIDAPERNTPEGIASKSAFAKIVGSQIIRCVPVDSGTPCDGRSNRMSFGRIVAQCFVGEVDIAQAMVDGGFACDWLKFSGGYYSRNGGCRK